MTKENIGALPVRVILEDAILQIRKALPFEPSSEQDPKRAIDILFELSDRIQAAVDFSSFPSEEYDVITGWKEMIERGRGPYNKSDEVLVLEIIFPLGSRDSDRNSIEKLFDRVSK